MVIVHNGDNSDAGDAAASLIGSIFTFFLFLFLAGCCVACCAVRYCMLKAQTAPEQSRTPSSFSGWLKSAVVRPAPTPLLVHADCTSPAQIHTCVLPEAPPWLTTQIGKAKPAPQTAYAVVVDAPQAQGQGASSVASKPPPPPPAGFFGTFNGPVAVVVGQPLL